MNLPPLGQLTTHPDIPEWMQSQPIAVPLFDGKELAFILQDIAGDEHPEEFSDAVSQFINLNSDSRENASPFVFQNYLNFCAIVDPDDIACEIAKPEHVWDCVHPAEVYVSRRHRRDRSIYVLVAAECDWEIEHGIQLVFRKGTELTRVSDQDGHLTITDAFDLPEEDDRIC